MHANVRNVPNSEAQAVRFSVSYIGENRRPDSVNHRLS